MDYNFAQQAEALGAADLLDDFFGGETLRNSPQKFVRDQVESLNADQRLAFDRISSVISDTGDQQRLFFVEGAGGCGIFLFILFNSASLTVQTTSRQNVFVQYFDSLVSSWKASHSKGG